VTGLGNIFNVIAPTGLASVVITSTNHYPNGVSGAGMHANVTIGPTNVSFYRVKMVEVGNDASEVSGYFTSTNHPPLSHKNAGADKWHPIGYNNLILDDVDNAYYEGATLLPSPWSPGGGFKWEIPAGWRVMDAIGVTNPLPWSDQVFTLGADGRMSVSKFGRTVSRTTQDVITLQ
jgi:hypothetical protein